MSRPCFVAYLLLLSVTGCGQSPSDAPQRRIVEGDVTCNGTPLEHGTIRFVPQPDGPVLTAEIQKGHYRADNKGGAPLGEVRIEITASLDAGAMSEDQILSGTASAPPVVVPSRFNTDSTLIETITKGSEPQKLNFDLTDK